MFDFAGITFHYPEDKITGMKWLGRGRKYYNNTVTGANWDYPEFKGYHADLYWVVVENKESPFTVYTDDQSIGDIGFLNGISPIGTRFQVPTLLGPESQKSIQLNYGIVKGTLWFDFR